MPDPIDIPRRSLSDWFHVQLIVFVPVSGKAYFRFRSTTKIIAHDTGKPAYHYADIVADPFRGVFLGRMLSFGKFTRFPIVGADTARTTYWTPWGPGIRPFTTREIGPTLTIWQTAGNCVQI